MSTVRFLDSVAVFECGVRRDVLPKVDDVAVIGVEGVPESSSTDARLEKSCGKIDPFKVVVLIDGNGATVFTSSGLGSSALLPVVTSLDF